MESGKYRNQVGAEIEVLRPLTVVSGYSESDLVAVNGRPVWQTLGGVWLARGQNPPFGDVLLLVTPQGLIDCGYELVVPTE